jgi:predicted metalloendopeptidase
MIDDYQQKRIEFRKILLGILSERMRWSRCVEWTNKKLGMAVGALFIQENFNHESKVGTAPWNGILDQLFPALRSSYLLARTLYARTQLEFLARSSSMISYFPKITLAGPIT